MKLLAVETATPASSVALGDGQALAAQAVQVDRRGHVGFLGAAIDFCFARAGWAPADLDAVVVDVGPGLFTGIRAGIATAQGIAAAVGVPVLPTHSVDALALRAATGRRRIWAVVDVRRGEVAVASYRPVPGGVVKEEAADLVDGAELRARIEADSGDALVVGDWQALGDAPFRGMHRVRTGRPRYPSAEILLEIGDMRLQKGVPAADQVRPLYLREPDAAINWAEFRHQGAWGSPG